MSTDYPVPLQEMDLGAGPLVYQKHIQFGIYPGD